MSDDVAMTRARSRSARVARLLDTRFRVPGTNFRFGWDPVISALPVVGDTAALLPSLIILAEARARKVRWRVIARMLLNLGIDWVAGLVPILGIALDAWFKANVRNLALLERELTRRG